MSPLWQLWRNAECLHEDEVPKHCGWSISCQCSSVVCGWPWRPYPVLQRCNSSKYMLFSGAVFSSFTKTGFFSFSMCLNQHLSSQHQCWAGNAIKWEPARKSSSCRCDGWAVPSLWQLRAQRCWSDEQHNSVPAPLVPLRIHFPISSDLTILQPESFPLCLAKPPLDNLFFKSSPKMLYFALISMIRSSFLVPRLLHFSEEHGNLHFTN